MNMNYSVAICTYNGEKYIAEQLNSIIKQSIPPTEIVISDDGSRDRTLEVVEKILSSSSIRYTIIHNQNDHGVSGNFFTAISACQEPIIFTSDQDDVWNRNKAEKMLPFFADKRIMLVFSDGELVSSNLEPIGTTIFKANGVSEQFLKEKDWMTYLYSNCIVTGATMALRTSLMNGISRFPKEWMHDAFLAVKAASLNGMAACDEKLILYRQHETNTVGMHEVEKREQIKEWVWRNSQLADDRARRYHRFLSLYQELHTCLPEAEKRRMTRFLSFMKDLSDVSTGSVPSQIAVIMKHYRNGDYSLFYSGGRTACRATIAVVLNRIIVHGRNIHKRCSVI